jgi:hypothetical protein
MEGAWQTTTSIGRGCKRRKAREPSGTNAPIGLRTKREKEHTSEPKARRPEKAVARRKRAGERAREQKALPSYVQVPADARGVLWREKGRQGFWRS